MNWRFWRRRAEALDYCVEGHQPHHGPLMPIGLQLAMPDQYPGDTTGQ